MSSNWVKLGVTAAAVGLLSCAGGGNGTGGEPSGPIDPRDLLVGEHAWLEEGLPRL